MATIVVRGRITAREGKEDELLRWMAELCAVVRDGEPGTMSFAFFADQAERSYVVVEAYESSEAVVAHMANAGPTIAELGELIEPGDDPLEVYGDLSEEALAVWAPFGPLVHSAVASR